MDPFVGATPTPEAAAEFAASSTLKPAGGDDLEFRRFRAGFLICLRTFPGPRVRTAPGAWTATPSAPGMTGSSYQPGKAMPIDEEQEVRHAYDTWVAAGRPG